MTFFPQCDTQVAIGFASRKRKEMEEEAGGNGQINIAERRKIALPSRKSDGHQTATFHPLGAEDNLRMLASLGLLETRASTSRLPMNGSPTSASSDASSSDHYFSSSHAGHYPNVEPYHRHNMSASSSGSMDIDPSTPAHGHGPQCSSLPQLYICHEMDSALYARCVDCSHSWHVGPGQSLSYSP
ncbi:hypothetical protein BCV69DRAFT_282361 [Microstroma glucosiphilum]|uniref:Uncharacterized protein n=1 Tax=Pseudomicrostroma glucosiphilum TaxID=1684307 RepID=A0A316U8R7_9BASI|nr:hypothetical protein BCV69DRAFT_282361 [Pseudomicrostroma glucosiphilum]PWN21647.1 hypothetical protein BCV69DRAFT_282361 [Pseudomicrostroma glucosiphilum]